MYAVKIPNAYLSPDSPQASGRGYALSTTEELIFIKEIAEATGIFLDPVYRCKFVWFSANGYYVCALHEIIEIIMQRKSCLCDDERYG